MSSQCRCIARFGCQEKLCFLDDRHAMHDRHKKFLLEEKFLHRSLSCQSVSEEHFEHPKVLTTLQKGLFDCEQTSCAQSVDHILKNVVLGKHFDIKSYFNLT